METKQLVDKFTNGEITEEQFNEERAKLTPEQQEQLKKDAEASMPDAVERLKSVRRGIDKIGGAKPIEDVSIAQKLREENLASAKESFFNELGISDTTERLKFEEEFKKEDSGSVTTENIIKDMRKTFAKNHADDYFNLVKEKNNREQEAEEFNANSGGAHGTGGGSNGDKKISKEVEDFIKKSAARGIILTREQAEHRLKLAANKGKIS